METLTSDTLFSLAIHLDFFNLLNFCVSSKRINNIIYKRDPIWRYRLEQDFLNDFIKFKDLNKTPKEFYILLWKLKDIKQQLNLEQDLFDIYNFRYN